MKTITEKQRYAGMDETGEYWVHDLAVNGEDARIAWSCGTLVIQGRDSREIYEAQECNSFCEAEAIIEHHCLVQFDHDEIHWSPSPGLPNIRRPIERSRR